MTTAAFLERIRAMLRGCFCSPTDIHRNNAANDLIGYRCYAGEVERLPQAIAIADTALSSSVFQSPGFVEIDGKVFDMRKDGVYRFYRLPELSEQRIVCTNGLESLLQSIGYLVGYGDDNNNLPVEEISEFLTRRRFIGGCTQLSLVSQKILNHYGFASRLVALMTLSSWGGEDDGHTLLEVKYPDNVEWILYDPSFGLHFKSRGRRLSLIEFSQQRYEDLEVERLPTNPGYSRFKNGEYDYDFWIGARFLSPEILTDWYRHIGALPLVFEKDMFYCSRRFAGAGDEQRISTRYKMLRDDDFNTRFY